MATLLLWGLFLVGAYQGRPPWKLLLLVFAAGELTFYSLALGFESYFLSQELLPFLSWAGPFWGLPPWRRICSSTGRNASGKL